MARGEALLNHRGWWVAGPEGYVGPSTEPPAAGGPRRAGLAEVRVMTLTAPPAQLEQELEAAFGPDSLVVTETLGQYRIQGCAAEASDVRRAEAWQGLELTAPYPIAVRAWLATTPQARAEDTVAVVERLSDTLMITVCQGRRILAYRQTEGDPNSVTHEVRRTLLGLGSEVSGPVRILASPELNLGEVGEATATALTVPCVGLRGLALLGRSAGFVSIEAARARQRAGERARLRRRAVLAGGLALAGGVLTAAGLIARAQVDVRQRVAMHEAVRLQGEIARLAPRRLGPVLSPLPLDQVGDLVAGIPPEAGLREATVKVEAGQARLVLRFQPLDPIAFSPRQLHAVLEGFPALEGVEVQPSRSSSGEVVWEGRARLRGRR